MITRFFALVLAVAAAASAQASVHGYDIKISNDRDIAVELELTSFHAADFSTTRPKELAESLKHRTRRIVVQPGEVTAVQFNDATGAFWVRWCEVRNPGRCGVVDLLRDALEIRIGRKHAI